MIKFKFSFLFVVILLLSSCSTTDEDKLEMSVDNLFEKGMTLFEDEDWVEAQKVFDAIRIQYPASQYADDALFYLSECYFNRDQFIIAAYSYNSLRRAYPTSPFYKKAFFKAGLSYYYESPPFDRDPEYTLKAIQSLSDFQSVYSDDSLTVEATKYINELRNKLAHHDYFTANLYRKLRSPNSALIYYNSVIENYNDTKYYEDAYLGKIEVLIEMRKYNQAVSTIDLYYSIFKNSKYAEEVKELQNTIPEEFQ